MLSSAIPFRERKPAIRLNAPIPRAELLRLRRQGLSIAEIAEQPIFKERSTPRGIYLFFQRNGIKYSPQEEPGSSCVFVRADWENLNRLALTVHQLGYTRFIYEPTRTYYQARRDQSGSSPIPEE
jgi:hypothetical protein